ncbi:MAG: metallophosphoesterase [Planctomycetota bacterium]|jgi:serine/threonine protein phosphatase 1
MTVFIGDVHGYIDRLEAILAECDADERLVFVGDLIDRGEDSAAVVARVRGLCEAGRAHCVLGNHEYALVRALGLPAVGIPACDWLFDDWFFAYGGAATARSYGVEDCDPQALREAVADDLAWFAGLPWAIDGRELCGEGWVVAHAGFAAAPALEVQLADVAEPEAHWAEDAPLPRTLFAKDRVGVRPAGCPAGLWLVCGHVPQRRVYRRDCCLCCDTSGGRPGRPLSAVRWPSARVLEGR